MLTDPDLAGKRVHMPLLADSWPPPQAPEFTAFISTHGGATPYAAANISMLPANSGDTTCFTSQNAQSPQNSQGFATTGRSYHPTAFYPPRTSALSNTETGNGGTGCNTLTLATASSKSFLFTTNSAGVASSTGLIIDSMNHPAHVPPFMRLPRELIHMILLYVVNRSDQLALLLTNKTLFKSIVGMVWFRPLVSEGTLETMVRTLTTPQPQLTASYGLLIRRLNFSNVASILTDEMFGKVSSITKLQRLTLAGCSKVTDLSLVPLLKANKDIQSLDISNLDRITGATPLTLAHHCKKLQGIYASHCALIDDGAVIEMARACKLMKRIKLNGCSLLSDASFSEIVSNCPYLVEIDFTDGQGISDKTTSNALCRLPSLREFRIANNMGVTNEAFLAVPDSLVLEKLRVLDLTSCVLLTDECVAAVVSRAPRLRDVVLAKCVNLTNRGVSALSVLGKSLHHVHLGHCSNITDSAIVRLAEDCPKIQYIDVACCNQLSNRAMKALATLTKLKRIGIVKCTHITDAGIFALAERKGYSNPLERIHLSYCSTLSLHSICELLNSCERLTHLSLTGVHAFMRSDITQFCRKPPPEFTQHQQSVFCVFSGDGVAKVRAHLNQLMMHERRELADNELFHPQLGPNFNGLATVATRMLDEAGAAAVTAAVAAGAGEAGVNTPAIEQLFNFPLQHLLFRHQRRLAQQQAAGGDEDGIGTDTDGEENPMHVELRQLVIQEDDRMEDDLLN